MYMAQASVFLFALLDTLIVSCDGLATTDLVDCSNFHFATIVLRIYMVSSHR
jgi:hypothetical protein